MGNREVILLVNRRRFKCENCQKPFSETLDFVGNKKSFTYRYAQRITEEVIHSDISNVAKTNRLTEEETPLYAIESFRYRDEVVATNGENNTYHAGAYLGDVLHEGAIISAFRVAQLIGSPLALSMQSKKGRGLAEESNA